MHEARIGTIAGFLNRELRVPHIKDASVNGLQVKPRNARPVARIGFAVDACISTFEKAKQNNVGLLVVHHGIKWRPQKDRELEQKRSAYLQKNALALYAAHLPLDLHAEFGNNIQLCRMLGAQSPRRFGSYHGVKIGYAGSFRQPSSLNGLAGIVNRGLNTECRVFKFGKERIRSIGIISGGGGSLLRDAVKEKLDCFLVGEIDLAVHNAAREYGMNLIVAGHYATETPGVRSLMPLIQERFGVETVFIDDRKDL